MTTTEVTVEPGRSVLRGVAVPYGEQTLVSGPTPRGRMVHLEVFDAQSIRDTGALYGRPLLIGHDQNRPIGRIRTSRSTGRGLEVEADLIGGDDEVEGLRRRLGAGVQKALSIGFFPSQSDDVWQRDGTTGPPVVTRRGVTIREVSIVVWPAYDGAIVTGVHAKTREGERRHAESVVAIATAKTAMAEADAYLTRRR